MKIRKMIILLIIVALGCLAYMMFSYYTPPSAYQPYAIPQKQDDTLRIAYLGDSWAFMHREHNCKISKLLQDETHRPVKVHSYGICGLTSKEFCENIFNNTDLKHFLQKRRYEYCFISLGINDTYKKMSTDYYKQSMDNIIRFFLANHIQPIILEIPDYDIYKSFNRQKLYRKLFRRISIIINKTPIDCKQIFRNTLDELLSEKEYESKVLIIRHKTWNSNYTKDLKYYFKGDGIHLTDEGYARLDSCIAEACVKLLKNSN